MPMHIGWEGLGMPSNWCSVHMTTVIINSKLRGTEQDSLPYVMKVILTHIPIEYGVADPYVDRFLNCSG